MIGRAQWLWFGIFTCSQGYPSMSPQDCYSEPKSTERSTRPSLKLFQQFTKQPTHIGGKTCCPRSVIKKSKKNRKKKKNTKTKNTTKKFNNFKNNAYTFIFCIKKYLRTFKKKKNLIVSYKTIKSIYNSV